MKLVALSSIAAIALAFGFFGMRWHSQTQTVSLRPGQTYQLRLPDNARVHIHSDKAVNYQLGTCRGTQVLDTDIECESNVLTLTDSRILFGSMSSVTVTVRY